jgi:amino acid adenylation domain-containing protein
VTGHPSPFLLHHGLERTAVAEPDSVAVVDGDRTLTYAELDAKAGGLAGLLLDLGVSKGDRVGLYLDKSLEAVAGIYGILKTGAAYVPFDPQAPTARLGYIAADCGVRYLLTAVEKADSWEELMTAGAPLEDLVVLNGDEVATSLPARITTASAVEERGVDRPDPRAIGADLAYVLYTSGSTGVPKGVMLSHTNGLAFVRWAVGEFGVRPDDRLSSHAPFHFDLSIFDLFAASFAGAAMVLVPPETSYFPVEIARFIHTNRISVWYSVPSVLNMLLHRGMAVDTDFEHLRTVLFAGEVFPTKYLRQLMHLLPGVRFCNLYGPTETNVCTWYDVPPIPESQTEPIPIGRAIDGVEAFPVTDQGLRAARGEVGELYVRGPTVMQGYWGDPERTARSLQPDRSAPNLKDLVYRTGDLVVERDDGDFQLLGRRDHQIKSRGYRIELGDIENTLYAHPSVVECAVLAVPDEMITNRIVAYVVVRGGPNRRELAGFCALQLPRYMIPEIFEFCESLPKTSTGKIDRQALSRARNGMEEA